MKQSKVQDPAVEGISVTRSGNLNRRKFLKAGTTGVVSLAWSIKVIRGELEEALKEVAPASGNNAGGYWEKIRGKFMLEEGFSYMNNGTLGPTPTPVLKALNEYWTLMAINPNENSSLFQSGVEVTRRQAAEFVGAAPEEIAIVRNTTEGLNTIVKGIDWKDGDEILVSHHEHASHLRPWQLHERRHGVRIHQVPIGAPSESPEAIVAAFERAITNRTRAISVAFVTTITGCILPVKELADLAHRKGLLCFADAAQATGMIQYNLREMGVDAFATSSHKWLCGPAGTGLLYVRSELQEKLWPNIVTQNYSVSKGARKYEQLSRRPWPVVAALADTLAFHLAIGKSTIESRIRELGSYLREEASKISGVTLYTSNDPKLSAGMTTLSVEGTTPGRLQAFLRERYDTYVSTQNRGELYPANVYGVDGIRVSTNIYNTFEQIEKVLEGLRKAARSSI